MSALTPRLLAAASLLTTSMAMLSLPVAAAGCEPRAVQNETRFPQRAQLRGHHGTVYVKVNIDTEGRASATSLHRSSGHRLLDRAAERSVRQQWRFDVSSCTAEQLKESHLVAVEYRNQEYGGASRPAKHSAKQLAKHSVAAVPSKT